MSPQRRPDPTHRPKAAPLPATRSRPVGAAWGGGLPQGRAEWRSALSRSGVVLLPVRLFLGVTFCFAGLQKLADPHFFQASRPTSIQSQLALFRHSSPIKFLISPVASHGVLVGVLIAIAELGVGLGVLLGLWTRAAAALGALLSLSFFLTVSWRTRPYYYGSDIVFVFLWLPFALVGADGVLSLDGWRRGRGALGEPAGPVDDELVTRRTVVATGAVAVGGLAFAGLDAVVGRGAAHDLAQAQRSAGPAPSASTSSGGVIASAAAVDAAGAVQFQDPHTGQPAWLVSTGTGKYAAFTAVCTHQGCTVQYSKSDEQFQCPCHGGVFDARTGKVLGGPPPEALAPISVTNESGQIRLA